PSSGWVLRKAFHGGLHCGRAAGRCAVTDLVIAQDQLDAEELGWQGRALCAPTDPDAFFPEKGRSTRAAKRVPPPAAVQARRLDPRSQEGVPIVRSSCRVPGIRARTR